MAKFEIKKRAASGNNPVACWHVKTEGITPNTVIDNTDKYTLLVKVDGVAKVSSAQSFTVHSLYNPGKTTKLIGGNKPYEDISIIAIDQSDDFAAEWGFGGPTAIPTIDRELGGVSAKVRVFGTYTYQIDNYYSFIRPLTFDENGEISKNAVREHLRGNSTEIIKNYLTSALAVADLAVCQGRRAEYCEDIKDSLSKKLESKGVSVKSFIILELDYDASHKEVRDRMDKAKTDALIGKIENQGKKDDISVQDAAADVQVKIIDARGKAGKAADKEIPLNVVYCPRCGTKNEDSRFCKKCGEKLFGLDNKK